MGSVYFTYYCTDCGIIKFKDLEEGITTREIIDESTGLSSNIVMDWKQQTKNQDLVPRTRNS